MFRNLDLSLLLMLLSLAAPALIMAVSVSCTGACLRCTVASQANTDALQPTCTMYSTRSGVHDMMLTDPRHWMVSSAV